MITDRPMYQVVAEMLCTMNRVEVARALGLTPRRVIYLAANARRLGIPVPWQGRTPTRDLETDARLKEQGRCTVCSLLLPHSQCIPSASQLASQRNYGGDTLSGNSWRGHRGDSMTLACWAIYRSPPGYEGCVVLRPWFHDATGVHPSRVNIVASSVDSARQLVPRRCLRAPREVGSDVTLVEMWV